jgi:hypothetical protein
MIVAELTQKNPLSVVEPSVKEGFLINEKFYCNAAAGSAPSENRKNRRKTEI